MTTKLFILLVTCSLLQTDNVTEVRAYYFDFRTEWYDDSWNIGDAIKESGSAHQYVNHDKGLREDIAAYLSRFDTTGKGVIVDTPKSVYLLLETQFDSGDIRKLYVTNFGHLMVYQNKEYPIDTVLIRLTEKHFKDIRWPD